MTQISAPRVILAPDKFKGSLSAPQVAAALAAGLTRSAPDADARLVPVADGGDGTVEAFVAAGWTRVELTAPGPTGVPRRAAYARHGARAVVELAAVVGLSALPEGRLDPLTASTYGLGVVLAHAMDHGVTDIVLGLGGSASTDGGAGMLQALGARILDADGQELPAGGAALTRAAELNRSALHPGVAATTFTLACDVDNPLLGPTGAVAVYAPQKGAGPAESEVLESALATWAFVAGPDFAGHPGAGAAGGTGFGALAVLGARVRSGIEVVLELLEFPDLLATATLVVTGEGSLDRQSLHGKAPVGVCMAARKAGVPVIAVVGRALLEPDEIRAAGFAGCYALADLEPDPARCMTDAASLLERVGARIATEQLT
ncbi:glycerate kinase [Nocardia sp. NBC_00508]|uniref:glycerate kinase family protein n=1 Tax=Nocardia sp. NBC_00508 TaxID=2975992 RepID=UPI002E807E41|nr:glycerate kinase [Nocardia sp. NBC_00508]WUD69258.1 glycerate kinase [Nocardia sp. NBC_00508]